MDLNDYTFLGWCSPEKRDYLMNWITTYKPKVIAEIGVFGGACLIPMAIAGQPHGAKTVGIDPWEVGPCLAGMVEQANRDWWAQHSSLKNAYHAAKDAVAKFELKNTELWVGTSNHYKDSFQDNEIGVLSIDGNHGPQAILDAKNYFRKVAPGGLIACDDTDWVEGGVFNVRHAIDWLRDQGCEFLSIVDTCTMLVKGPKAD